MTDENSTTHAGAVLARRVPVPLGILGLDGVKNSTNATFREITRALEILANYEYIDVRCASDKDDFDAELFSLGSSIPGIANTLIPLTQTATDGLSLEYQGYDIIAQTLTRSFIEEELPQLRKRYSDSREVLQALDIIGKAMEDPSKTRKLIIDNLTPAQAKAIRDMYQTLLEREHIVVLHSSIADTGGRETSRNAFNSVRIQQLRS